MDPSDEVCKSLIKWLQSVIPDSTKPGRSDITDGVAMLEALVKIAPEYFSHLEPKIKCDVGSNWRLKVSNLKKIIESIVEYYQDVLNVQVLDIGKPDVVKIAETRNLTHVGKMLRLILGCAVNCDKKQEYITQIMSMEESVQQCIMQAIQQLEELTGGPTKSVLSLLSLESDSRMYRLVEDLNIATEAKEALAQKCHDLELQVQSLMEDKQTIVSDNEHLKKQLKEREVVDNGRSPDVRRQMELLKEELYKAETTRDDYRAKILEQEKQLMASQAKVNELQLKVQLTSHLKDEVDALSESADKVKALETTLASYKKRLEDFADVKKQLKYLEDKNVSYLQYNLKCEEELKKLNMWKNQCEMYKSQAAELQQKLDEESQKADKALFQNKNLESKLVALQSERDRLVQEIEGLKEENEELKLGQTKDSNGAAMAQELTPTEMKERLRFLEKENKSLRNGAQEAEAKQALLNDALNRLEKLQDQNRSTNQRVLELEAQLDEEQQKSQRDEHSNHSVETAVKEYKQKCAVLQETLALKENELHVSQERYNRSLEKAREVALSLENKGSNGTDSFKSPLMSKTEERMLVSAFYNLSHSCQRDAVDERLAMLSAGQGQSFLCRQRQPVPRKSVQNLKNK